MTIKEYLEMKNFTQKNVCIFTGYGDGGDGNLPIECCLNEKILTIHYEDDNYAEIEI